MTYAARKNSPSSLQILYEWGICRKQVEKDVVVLLHVVTKFDTHTHLTNNVIVWLILLQPRVQDSVFLVGMYLPISKQILAKPK